MPVAMALRGMPSNWCLRILDHDHATRGFDLSEAQRAVGAGAGQDDANRPLLLVVGQRTEKEIDGHAHTALLNRLGQVQLLRR